MATYHVKCRGQVDETYAVDADSETEAMTKWIDGKLIVSEAWDVFPISAELIDEQETS